MGLATNDVQSFIRKQTVQKRVNKGPDPKILKATMQSKLMDAVAHAQKLRRQRDIEKKRLSKKYASCKAKGRRILESLNMYYKTHKEEAIQAARYKIENCLLKDELEKSP